MCIWGVSYAVGEIRIRWDGVKYYLTILPAFLAHLSVSLDILEETKNLIFTLLFVFDGLKCYKTVTNH